MTEKEYNAAEGVRRSDLWRIHESPEKYKWFMEHPEPASQALVFGQLVHTLLLTPDSFDDDFAVAPNIDKRTKAGKEEWQQFAEANSGKAIITLEDLKTASEMVIKVSSNPYVRKLLKGKREQPFFWTDDDTGEKCKVRVDILTDMDGALTVADYKTTTDARTDVFVNRDMHRYGYVLQSYMYTEGVMKAMGLTERPDFIFIVQEKKPPYAVNLIRVTEDVMTMGQDIFRELIGTLHDCKETGLWWGYTGIFGEPNDAYLPGWAQLGDEE